MPVSTKQVITTLNTASKGLISARAGSDAEVRIAGSLRSKAALRASAGETTGILPRVKIQGCDAAAHAMAGAPPCACARRCITDVLSAKIGRDRTCSLQSSMLQRCMLRRLPLFQVPLQLAVRLRLGTLTLAASHVSACHLALLPFAVARCCRPAVSCVYRSATKAGSSPK